MLPLWDAAPRRRAPVITATIILANAVVFFYEAQLALAGRLEPFVREHALVPARLLAGWDDPRQWLTVLTHMFLHAGWLHVAGNCWFLWVFGRHVEDRLGGVKYLLLYFSSGVAAAALEVAMAPGVAVPMLGASGAISGVLGAYLVLAPGGWIYALVPWIVPIVPVPAAAFLVLWFVLQAYSGFGLLLSGNTAAGGVAWWAHVGGFAAGAGLTLRVRRALRWRA